MASRTAFLESLPYPDLMRQRLRTFAMYDSIAAPEFRSFEFHPKWGPGAAQMGAFKDGSGNFFFAWFSAKGAVIRGFDHESVMSPFRQDPPVVWPGIFEGLPPALAYAVDEVAFVPEEITFAFWATGREGDWKAGRVKPAKGKDADGAQRLLSCFQQSFERWRKAYYDTPRSSALRVLWDNEPITREVVLALNPEADLKVVREEAKLLGWKTSGLEGRNAKADARAEANAEAKAKAIAKAKANAGKPKVRSFGAAEFVVRCEPTRVRMLIHGKTVVAEAKVDVYNELFALVKARLVAAKRSGA
jgi:hypothetical protein